MYGKERSVATSRVVQPHNSSELTLQHIQEYQIKLPERYVVFPYKISTSLIYIYIDK